MTLDKKRMFDFYKKEGRRAHHQEKLLWKFPELFENITTLLKQQALRSLSVFLDIGCAEGYYVNFMSKYAEFCVGIDISLPKLKRFKSTKNSYPVLADADSLPFKPGVISLILCSATLEHLVNPLLAVKESYRVLKPNGHIIFAVPQDHSNVQLINLMKDAYLKLKKVNIDPFSDGSGGHLHSFSPNEIKRLIELSGLLCTYINYVPDLRLILNDIMLLFLKRGFGKTPTIYIIANKPTKQDSDI